MHWVRHGVEEGTGLTSGIGQSSGEQACILATEIQGGEKEKRRCPNCVLTLRHLNLLLKVSAFI